MDVGPEEKMVTGICGIGTRRICRNLRYFLKKNGSGASITVRKGV